MAISQERITTSQVARILNLSTKRVYQLIDRGVIEPAERTPLGMLFDRAVIEELAAQRAAEKATA